MEDIRVIFGVRWSSSGVRWSSMGYNFYSTLLNLYSTTTLCGNIAAGSIAEYKMAQIEYAFPVEKIHGKISKKHKIGFAHRTASGVNYSTMYGKRRTKPSTAEIANREKFKAVAQAAQARLINPEYIQRDQYGFSKQTKYTTLWGYVFNEVYQTWEG